MRRADRQITLDVEVTNTSGNSLSGLKPQDFTLLDNGTKQTISAVREITAASNPPPTEVVLLLDTMNATFQDVVLERQGVEAFLHANGGQLPLPVSIVFLSDMGVKLNKASQDGKALADDLSKLQTPIRVLNPAQGANGAQDRQERSIRALQMLCTYEATRPGRKLLIWVGPGWPLLSRSTAEVSERDHRLYYKSLADTTTAIRRAHITLYSVAPLNLAQTGGPDPFLYQNYLQGVSTPAQADSPNLALQVLAQHSGGLVLSKSGDLASQINRCVADSKIYYEITFEAAEDSSQGQYHALTVKLAPQGAIARTDTAYYTGGPQSTLSLPPTATPGNPAASPTAPTTLHAVARLVVVDVSVLDKKGLPVPGLKSQDFVLREDSTPQKITSVESHGFDGTLVPASPQPTLASNGTVSVTDGPSAIPPVWHVVLVDTFNMQPARRGGLQAQLERFLKQLPETAPVALVTMTGRIHIDTSFDEGAGAAYRYLHKNGLGALDASGPADIVGSQYAVQSLDNSAAGLANKANIDIDRQANRAQTTLSCFSALAQWLKLYPGRKNVYWLSEGFPLIGQPFGSAGLNSMHPNGAGSQGGHPLPMQEAIDKELESARVSIYPVDAQGVATPSIAGETSADTSGNFLTNQAITNANTAKGEYDPAANYKVDRDLTTARQSEMLEIAHATGGVPRFSNDIAQSLHTDFSQDDRYYTISYTPSDPTWNGSYRRIHLDVKGGQGYQLTYREGYYARDPAAPPQPTPEEFRDALRPGTPSAFAVHFTASVTRSASTTTVEYTVDPKTVGLRADEAGAMLADLQFAALEYDAKGNPLEKRLIRWTEKMSAEQRDQISPKPLTATQTMVFKNGATTLLVGVRDTVSGRFGKAEILLLKN